MILKRVWKTELLTPLVAETISIIVKATSYHKIAEQKNI